MSDLIVPEGVKIVGVLQMRRLDLPRNPYPINFEFEPYLAGSQEQIGYGWGRIRVFYSPRQFPSGLPTVTTSQDVCFDIYPEHDINSPRLEERIPPGNFNPSNPSTFGSVFRLTSEEIASLEETLERRRQYFLDLPVNIRRVGKVLRAALRERRGWETDPPFLSLIDRLLSVPPTQKKGEFYVLKELVLG